MANPTVTPARRAAWDVLCAWLLAKPESARLGSPKRPFPPPDLAPRERALAKTLAEGTVRRQLTLDHVLRELGRGRDPRPTGLRAALLLGAWQLLFAPEIAAHAAVGESVTLARRAAGEGGARFANALLRRLAGARDLERWVAPPEPGGADAAALALWWSFPAPLVARWLEEHGPAQTARLLEAFDAEPWLGLRTNARRIDREELARRLTGDGIRTRPGFHPLTLLVEKGGSAAVVETRAFEEGLFSVQDSSQTEVVDLLDLAPGLRVLDFCAAPGGKATAIAEALDDRGAVLAWDANPERLARLPKESERLGLRSLRVLESREALTAAAADGPFDRVLVDAPCSNTGVLGRRPEARWRFAERRLAALVAAQAAIVADAAAFLRPGGRLVYATCSIEREENEELAGRLAEPLGLRLISSERVLPELGLRDGGGVSVFVKREEP